MKFLNPLITSALLFHCTAHAYAGLIVKKAEKEMILTGYTRSAATVTVTSEVSGKVLTVNYDVGQAISQKPFIEIDPTFIDFQIKNTVHSIAKIEVALKRTRSRVAYLRKEFERIDALHKGDRATEVRRDAAAQDLEQARLELDATSQEKAMLSTSLEELKERKNRHNVPVPPGWIVTERQVEAGEVIQAGMPLAEIANYKTLVVPLSVSGEELSAIKSLPKTFDAVLEGKKVKASLNWINPAFDEKTRKLKIELVVKGYGGDGRGGLKFAFSLKVKTQGVLVPQSAVIERYENPSVIVKKTGEKIHIMVLGSAGNYLIVADDNSLTPGTELAHPESVSKRLRK